MTSYSIRGNWLLYIGMVLAFCSLACFILAGNGGAIIVWLCIAGVLLLLIWPYIPRQRPPAMQNQQRHRHYGFSGQQRSKRSIIK